MSISKEEIIKHLSTLILEGKCLFVTRSYEKPDFSFGSSSDNESRTEYYRDVNHDRYPVWRMKSLAFLKKILGDHSTYVKEFVQNCEPISSETYLQHGIGILEAVKSDYGNDIVLEEVPPESPTNNAPTFQITNINEVKNEVEVEYKVSNFQVLIDTIEKSNREDKSTLVQEVQQIQKELEEGPADWNRIQKWCQFALGLGKDLGINLLANIIAKSTGIG